MHTHHTVREDQSQIVCRTGCLWGPHTEGIARGGGSGEESKQGGNRRASQIPSGDALLPTDIDELPPRIDGLHSAPRRSAPLPPRVNASYLPRGLQVGGRRPSTTGPSVSLIKWVANYPRLSSIESPAFLALSGGTPADGDE